MTERLSAEQVLEFNRVLCEDTGEHSALLDEEGLKAAVERPWSGFGEVELFPTLYEKAAALLHALASRQVFENGNKRTAWAAAVAFLDINGIDIGHVETVQSDMFVRAAALDHSLEISDIAEWFSVAHKAFLVDESQDTATGDFVSTVEQFVNTAAPLVFVETSTEGALGRAFPDGKDGPESPLGTAMIFWQALEDPVAYRNALKQLSLDPSIWGDYSQAAEAIADRSIATTVVPCEDDEDIKYVKFIDFAGSEAGVVVDEAPIDDLHVLTVVRPPDSAWWFVWGLSHNYFPSLSQIRKSTK